MLATNCLPLFVCVLNTCIAFADRNRTDLRRAGLGTTELHGDVQERRKPVRDPARKGGPHHIRPDRPQQETAAATARENHNLSHSLAGIFHLLIGQAGPVPQGGRHGADAPNGMPAGELRVNNRRGVVYSELQIRTIKLSKARLISL